MERYPVPIPGARGDRASPPYWAMLTSVKAFVRKYLETGNREDADTAVSGTHLAVAALLVEVLRADFDVSDEERRHVLGSLQRLLDLDPAVCDQLLALAEQHIDRSHDLYQFTSAINRSYSPEDKQRLLEELWRVAHADERLHKYEEHLIRRIADLLHLRHSEFIATKLRSQRPG
jgi:uncharacterized tellurite resistance protein B-like protein